MSATESAMGAYLWFILAFLNEVTATFRPRQLSPCQVVNMDVYCNDLNLRTIPEELPPNIYTLDLSRNLLQNLTQEFLAFYTTIHHLNLHSNKIQFIQPGLFKDMTNLQELDLSKNYLDIFAVSKTENLSFGENTLQLLEELYLNGNILGTIDPLTFYRLPRIRDLHLQQNFLSVCGSHHRLPQRGHHSQASDCVFLSSIPTLHYLYLSRNSLESVPQNAFRGSPLLVLDLSENPGLDIHQNAFSGLEPSLTHLSLKENDLGVLKTDLSVLSSLKNVDLSVNRLTALPLWNKETVIESLNLQNNSLVTLEYSTVLVLEKTLKTLYLGSNPLSCCGNLKFLRMVQKSSMDIPDIASVTCQYTQDSEHKEISIMSVEQEHCDTIDKKSLGIIVIIITALVLIGVLTLLSKMCHPRRRRLRRSFKA
ncbi:hypothetical protein MATL_G00040340 [Megalops atlanticus]|uniref:Leucine-rich repeat-containing protein 32 n=1 Tax=Megalops atlanticus TaxID=7932 RepID=A0A9D3QA46_MEGAT|nr:hypothetical protein MATL_G00040340 [Megalops atlanticus]